MAMDSLTEWYRYIDQVSRPARRLEDDEEPEQWRPWKPNDEAPPVDAAIPAEAIPDLSVALGLTGQVESRQVASVEYVDPTLHDQLAPIPTFSAPTLSAPPFEILISRLGESASPLERTFQELTPDEPRSTPAVEAAIAPLRAELTEPGLPTERQSAVDEWTEAEEPGDFRTEEEDGAGGKGQGFRHWDLLSQIRSHDVAQNSYKSTFRETREELVQRLLDPPLTLEETARLLGVCPTTVRRYTNKGQLSHFRTMGNQRRFRLSDVLEFLESRATEIEADARADREAGLDT